LRLFETSTTFETTTYYIQMQATNYLVH